MMTREAFVRLCQARERLRETDEGRLSIAEVARDATVSPFHFIRQFKAMFGETPHQFRMQAQLDRARHLLATSEASVTDVCMNVGFSSLGSFSDLFARRTGAPPSAYRRRARALLQAPGAAPDVLTPGCLSLMTAAFAISEKQPAAVPVDAGAAPAAAASPSGRAGITSRLPQKASNLNAKCRIADH